MSATWMPPPARTDSAAIRPLDDAIWPGHTPADRACCCAAWAMVQVVMPPTPARPHRTELLLCGHHYRVSHQALAAAGATVRELPWIPDSTAAWIRAERHGSLAQVSNKRMLPLGNGTRLVTRVHGVRDWRSPLAAVVGMLLMEFGDFATMRRMLRGIKSRAEGLINGDDRRLPSRPDQALAERLDNRTSSGHRRLEQTGSMATAPEPDFAHAHGSRTRRSLTSAFAVLAAETCVLIPGAATFTRVPGLSAPSCKGAITGHG